MRYAIYFTPSRSNALTAAASGWLGRDAFTGQATPATQAGRLNPAEIAYHTALPRRYGFHATIAAPFRLKEDRTERQLHNELSAFCGDIRAFTIPRLRVSRIGPFFALVPAEDVPELDILARQAVARFSGFRAPLSDDEIERRKPDSLTTRQLDYLHRYGYPYVMEEYRFHMTLTGPIPNDIAPRIEATLAEIFEPLLADPVTVDGLALFVEDEPGAPFVVSEQFSFGAARVRKTA